MRRLIRPAESLKRIFTSQCLSLCAEREMGVAYAWINAGTALSQVLIFPYLKLPLLPNPVTSLHTLATLTKQSSQKYIIAGRPGSQKPVELLPLRLGYACIMLAAEHHLSNTPARWLRKQEESSFQACSPAYLHLKACCY